VHDADLIVERLAIRGARVEREIPHHVSHAAVSLIDWGAPRAPEWAGPRERLVALVPAEVAWALRERAREEGVALSVLVGRLLAGALEVPYQERIGSREPWPAAVDALIG